MYLGGFADVK